MDPAIFRHIGQWLRFSLRMFVVLMGTALLALGLLCFVAITVPVSMIRAKLAERRTARRLAEFPCPHCGEPLGEAAIRTARGKLTERYQELWRGLRTPAMRMQFSEQYLEIHCARCGGVTRYSPRNELLVVGAEASQESL